MLKVLRHQAVHPKHSTARTNDEGASAVEYGLLVAAIAAVIVALVFALGAYVRGAFQKSCDSIANQGVTTSDGSTCSGSTGK